MIVVMELNLGSIPKSLLVCEDLRWLSFRDNPGGGFCKLIMSLNGVV